MIFAVHHILWSALVNKFGSIEQIDSDKESSFVYPPRAALRIP